MATNALVLTMAMVGFHGVPPVLYLQISPAQLQWVVWFTTGLTIGYALVLTMATNALVLTMAMVGFHGVPPVLYLQILLANWWTCVSAFWLAKHLESGAASRTSSNDEEISGYDVDEEKLLV
jgi:hypothetical protein